MKANFELSGMPPVSAMSEQPISELSPDEAALIERHLDFYRSLDTGRRSPTSSAQHHFVAVCRCQAKAATLHEVAYVKYRMLIANQHQDFTDSGWKRMRGQYLSNSD